MSLDELITRSLWKIDSVELRQKMAGSVVITGGTANARGLIEMVEERVFQRVEERQKADGVLEEHAIKRVEVVLCNLQHKISYLLAQQTISE
jgi:actin-related protein